MATFYPDETAGSANTLQATAIGDRINGRILTSRMSTAVLTYTMLGTEAAADVINLIQLEAGTQILTHLSRTYSNAIATTATLDIGDLDALGVGTAADPDRWADGLDVAAAGWDLFSANSSAAQIVPYNLGSRAWVQCTFKTLVTPVAGKILTFWIVYIGA